MSERRISARPLVLMSAGIAVIIGLTATLQRVQDDPSSVRTVTVKANRQEQDVCDMCAKAINAIQKDDRAAEQAVLDKLARNPLELHLNAVGQGALKSNSPGTLMMQLGYALRDQAVRDASAGSWESGRHAIMECRRLSEHVLSVSNPSLPALTISHSLDQIANEAEARAFPGDQKDRTHEKTFWRSSIVASIQKWRFEWDGKSCLASEREASESELAARLTAQYRLFRINQVDRATATTTPAVGSRPTVPTPSGNGAA